jgi:hypothetical protein
VKLTCVELSTICIFHGSGSGSAAERHETTTSSMHAKPY